MNQPHVPLWRISAIWLMIGLPLASIFAGVGLLITAIRAGGADVVTDEVTRVSQIQTTDLGPDMLARQLNLSFVIRVVDGAITVFPVSGEVQRDVPLKLSLIHPISAKEDLYVELLPNDLGWEIKEEIPTNHDWNLQLTPVDGTWRLHGRLERGQHATRLAPLIGP
ncbi:MAG: FixH family protein [Xanthomonadaceae bacterium]|jgi:hypothetical protein|nr:FixH family protein [Xanthomonadaceae bacterium]